MCCSVLIPAGLALGGDALSALGGCLENLAVGQLLTTDHG